MTDHTTENAMIDAYLLAQRAAVEEADRFGRPNVGGLHTNTVRAACLSGLKAAIEAGGLDCAHPPSRQCGCPACAPSFEATPSDKAAPAWHDAPTCAGNWFSLSDIGYSVFYSLGPYGVEDGAWAEGARRYYGPIPDDQP